MTTPDGHLKYATKDGTGWHIESVDTNGEFMDIAVGSNGYAQISYRYWDSTEGYALGYAYRDATGWHPAIVESDWSGDYTSIALNAANHPSIVYNLGYAHKDAAGWHFETIDAGVFGSYPSLDLDDGGSPHVSYYDSTNDDLKYAYRDTTGWHPAALDSDGNVGLYTSMPWTAAILASSTMMRAAVSSTLPTPTLCPIRGH